MESIECRSWKDVVLIIIFNIESVVHGIITLLNQKRSHCGTIGKSRTLQNCKQKRYINHFHVFIAA